MAKKTNAAKQNTEAVPTIEQAGPLQPTVHKTRGVLFDSGSVARILRWSLTGVNFAIERGDLVPDIAFQRKSSVSPLFYSRTLVKFIESAKKRATEMGRDDRANALEDVEVPFA